VRLGARVNGSDGKTERIGLFLSRVARSKSNFEGSETELYRRIRCHTIEMACSPKLDEAVRKKIYVLQDEQAEHIVLIDSWG
jgi:hypothetical protein